MVERVITFKLNRLKYTAARKIIHLCVCCFLIRLNFMCDFCQCQPPVCVTYILVSSWIHTGFYLLSLNVFSSWNWRRIKTLISTANKRVYFQVGDRMVFVLCVCFSCEFMWMLLTRFWNWMWWWLMYSCICSAAINVLNEWQTCVTMNLSYLMGHRHSFLSVFSSSMYIYSIFTYIASHFEPPLQMLYALSSRIQPL